MNIYIGDGVRKDDRYFEKLAPSTVQAEFQWTDDLQMQSDVKEDPNPPVPDDSQDEANEEENEEENELKL